MMRGSLLLNMYFLFGIIYLSLLASSEDLDHLKRKQNFTRVKRSPWGNYGWKNPFGNYYPGKYIPKNPFIGNYFKVDGGWSQYNTCSKTCGKGTKERTCTNPKPSSGGKLCFGSKVSSCNNQDCPLPGCNIETDLYIYASKTIKEIWSISQDECASSCASTDGCVAWTLRQKDNRCWLKSDDSSEFKWQETENSIPYGQCVTGGKECGVKKNKECTIEDGVYINAGNNVKTMPSDGPLECASACATTDGCLGWTMRTSDNYCWLKSDISAKGRMDGWITGTKECGIKNGQGCTIETDVQIQGGKMETNGEKAGISQEECANFCATTDGCVAWTMNGHGDDSKCFLKSDDSKKIQQKGWTTGTVDCGVLENQNDIEGCGYEINPNRNQGGWKFFIAGLSKNIKRTCRNLKRGYWRFLCRPYQNYCPGLTC